MLFYDFVAKSDVEVIFTMRYHQRLNLRYVTGRYFMDELSFYLTPLPVAVEIVPSTQRAPFFALGLLSHREKAVIPFSSLHEIIEETKKKR